MKSVKIYLVKILILFLFVLQLTIGNEEKSVVEKNGFLKVAGNKIVNESNEIVVLRGMSLFWSQWMGQYYNPSCVKWLKEDWKCTVVRAAMGIEHGGYLENPETEKSKVRAVIDACIAEGIYVIVDWHDHYAHLHQEEAIKFFKEIAEEYKDYPNIIYEIYNEPKQISWIDTVKPYSEAVIKEIRKIDSKNLILVGSPTWSQDVDVAVSNPITAENIAYSLHFYAATHKQYLRGKAQIALDKGYALFVSEFGTVEATGDGILDYGETEAWMNFMEENKISWCNWSIADKAESSAALLPGGSGAGNWKESELTESGKLIRSKLHSYNIITSIYDEQESINEKDFFTTYPNPFNNEFNLRFVQKKSGRVKLNIINTIGENVGTLLDKDFNKGEHKVNLSLKNYASGNYFLLCRMEENEEIIKIQLLK